VETVTGKHTRCCNIVQQVTAQDLEILGGELLQVGSVITPRTCLRRLIRP
jgi:hypothetical protein